MDPSDDGRWLTVDAGCSAAWQRVVSEFEEDILSCLIQKVSHQILSMGRWSVMGDRCAALPLLNLVFSTRAPSQYNDFQVYIIICALGLIRF